MTITFASSGKEALFADSFYLIALLNTGDQYHDDVLEVSREASGSPVWTTEWVLLELADACSDSTDRRKSATLPIRSILAGQMTVVMATPELWRRALQFYERHSRSEE